MCTLWIFKNLAKLQGKVMCRCSYLNEEELTTRKKRVILPTSSASSSQVTTPTNPKTSPSSSTSQREISTTFFPSSPRSPRRSQALEEKTVAWIAKDEAARNGGSTTRTILPQLKRGKLKRRVTIGSTTLSNSSGSGDVEEADWPPFADEDYIVFCFEEDGAFHVMEESPKTTGPKLLECEEHGSLSCACSYENKDENKDVNNLRLVNRRDCLLPNKEAEEEMSSSPLSPKLLLDGTDTGDLALANSTITVKNELRESMECRNGSVESTDSSHYDDEEQFQIEHSPQVEQSSFSWNLISQDDIALPALGREYYTDVAKEDKSLSPKSKLGVMISIDDLLLKGDNDRSSIESDQSSGFSVDSRGDQDDVKLEGNEKLASESAKSSISKQSQSSSNSFEFPVLEWAWVGSPVTWPKTGRRLRFRRHKPRPPACLRCCKFQS